ncbi:hypothetical protein J2736_001433 [Paenibacillus qinlingensis]|uniref:Uncharacterized protein n=1 Tax=Paenibacillus qinlingensis TaxID=1837343 RepID=A0ABU1NS24_9BACL|nr:hypothetical protein [Paenibacillus qinlingensis]
MIWNTLKSKGFLSGYMLILLMLVGAVCLEQKEILCLRLRRQYLLL